MEAFQLRSAHRSSCHRFRHGTGQVKRQKSFPKLVSDTISRSSDTTNEDLFTGELGLRCSGKVVRAPIKKLLAEDMARESESRRRSTSVIARLMGLDGHPQPPSHKQQKRSSENYVQRVASMETAQRSSPLYSCRSSRKSSKEEQEFKDVFEVLDAQRMENGGHILEGTVNTKLTEAEMAFIQQKFMDAKRLSTDRKLQNSKEFHDAVDDLNSNKDLLLKFLQQPDSLFTKHVHDLDGTLPQYHCGHTHVPALKSSHSPHCENNDVGYKIKREIPCKNWKKARDGPVGHSSGKSTANNGRKSSKVHLERKDDSMVLPTRIVVLKPNLGEVQNGARTVSSPHPSHGFLSDSGNHSGVPSFRSSEAEVRRKKRVPDDAGPSRYKSRESREIAKEITRQMRNSFRSGSTNFSTTGFRGYAGDESSSSRSENESVNESDETAVTSRHSTEWNNRSKPSSSCSTESSVSREARKRLLERWKMTNKSVDMGVVSRGCTLADMLAIPDKEVGPENSDALIGTKVFSDKCDFSDGAAGGIEPLGISSRDGWKNGRLRNLSRSRSVPASSTLTGSPKTGMRFETLRNDRYMMPKDVMLRERTEAVKGNYSQREGSSSRTSRSRAKKSIVSHGLYSDCSEASPEIHFSQNLVKGNIMVESPIEQSHSILETSASKVTNASLDPASAVDLPVENIATPSQARAQDLSACMSVKSDSSSSDLQILNSQEPPNGPPEKGCSSVLPVAELESPASTKEADQPSPISVLETPFPDDLSSGSEYFESLSADLHGLRMQLQLLKLESEAYVEGPMPISSDEDVEPGSVGLSERGATMQSREFSYAVDALLDSGINYADLDTFMVTCHSPECPVSPQVFEELEKKYRNHASWPRSERRLLFDRINFSLLVIYQQFLPPHPWVGQGAKLSPKWAKNRLEDGLHKLLASQDKRATKETTAEMVLANELQWLDLGSDIDVIGREIERLLTDELLTELLMM